MQGDYIMARQTMTRTQKFLNALLRGESSFLGKMSRKDMVSSPQELSLTVLEDEDIVCMQTLTQMALRIELAHQVNLSLKRD